MKVYVLYGWDDQTWSMLVEGVYSTLAGAQKGIDDWTGEHGMWRGSMPQGRRREPKGYEIEERDLEGELPPSHLTPTSTGGRV